MGGEDRSGRTRHSSWGLPLFRKELLEQAARPRTYWVRVVYAAILVAVFLLYFLPLTRRYPDSPELILGSGRTFLDVVAYSLFAVTYLVVPPLVASAFPAERERGSLALLWLTGLRPTEILAEKFLARVFPALTLLLTSLPLLTIAYAFGGITTDRLWVTYYWLFLACLQLGSVALFFSTALKSAMRAILLSYLAVLLLNGILPLVEIWMEAEPFTLSPIGKYAATWRIPPAEVVVESLPIAVSVGVFLVLGRLILRGEFSPRTSPLQRTEAGSRLAARIGRAVRWFKEVRGLPDREPVAWRASGGGLRGRFARMLGAILILECALVLIALSIYGTDLLEGIGIFVVIIWFIAVPVITLRGVNAMIHERTRQSLNVLLVTPLTRREILHQKWKGLRRTSVVLGLTMLPLFVLHTLYLIDESRASRGFLSPLDPGVYLTASFLSVVIYMPLLAFLSLWVGLWARTTVRATLTALFAVLLACALPLLVMGLLGIKPDYAWVLSPAVAVFLSESGFRLIDADPWGWFTLNFALWGGLLGLFRGLYLRGGRRHLGRVE